MSFKFKHTEKITGVFILLAVVILIIGTIVISVSKKTFVKTHGFKTRLSDAAGLSTATSLSFKGYEIGRVRKFLLDKDNNIDVDLAVYKEFREKIVRGSAIYRLNNPITGETSLVLLQPRRPYPTSLFGGIGSLLPEGEYIPSLDMDDGQKLLEENVIEKSGETISLIFDEARIFVTNLRDEFKLKKDTFKAFFENLHGVSESLARNQALFDHLQQLLDPVNGPVFQTLEQFSHISKKLSQSINQLNEIMENYKDPEGLMTKLFQVNQQQLNQTLENLNKNLIALHQMLNSLKESSPLIADLLDKSRKTLQAINNNPLLRGGIETESKNTNSSRKKRREIEE
ncbi:MAG: MlaD family protein [Candidatus Aminicenantes bacterium]|jgi:ABC-type transporter Mla subunit MlaD